MYKHLNTVATRAALTLALALPAQAQRIIGIQSSNDAACEVVRYNPFTDGVIPTGYTHDYSVGLIQMGSSTIDPISGRYYILTEEKTQDPNDDNNFLVNSVIRAVNTNTGSFDQYKAFETYKGPYQLEFSMQDGKLYGIDRGYVPGLRLLHFNPATGESTIVGTYDDVLQRQSGDKFSAFDSDNQRYIYLSSRVKPTFSISTPTVSYIDVQTGEITTKDVTLTPDNQELQDLFNSAPSHIIEAQYDNVENEVIALWCINNQPTRIVKINEAGEMRVLATYEAPSAGLQMVFDQASGNIVFQRMYGSDISNAAGFVTVIDSRDGNLISEVATTQFFANWECDNSQFAALRYKRESTLGVNDEAINGNLLLTPNPSANGVLNLRSTKQISSLNIASMVGEVVFRSDFIDTAISLAIPALANGTYMVQVMYSDGTAAVTPWHVIR